MLNNRKKVFLTISATMLLVMLFFYYYFVVNMTDKIDMYFWMINMKVIIYALFYLTITFLTLLFFSDEVFSKWFKKFFIWYVPLSVILILTGGDGVSYVWFSKAYLVNNFGVILVITTLIFALVQKFVYKI